MLIIAPLLVLACHSDASDSGHHRDPADADTDADTDSDSDTTTGNTNWTVYPGASGGFSATSEDWFLPSSLGAGLFTQAYDSDSADNVAWEIYNLGEDNVSDVVVANSESDDAVGKTYWQIGKAICR